MTGTANSNHLHACQWPLTCVKEMGEHIKERQALLRRLVGRGDCPGRVEPHSLHECDGQMAHVGQLGQALEERHQLGLAQ